jgi:ethanolamine utilization protein EutP (predicted NTPase)
MPVDSLENIWDLIQSSDAGGFARLIAEHPELAHTPTGDYNEQALHFAAWQDKDAHISVLLDAGADIDAPGEQGRTPLHYAAMHGCPAAARILILRGANKDKLDTTRFSPAFHGIRGREEQSVAVAKMLVAAGAEVDLNLAVCLGDTERVETLLNTDPLAIEHARFPKDLVLDAVIAIHGHISAELPLDDKRGMNEPLIAMQRCDHILKLLLDRGAPIDSPEFGWSPLFYSCQMHHPHLTELLLLHGANPNVKYQGRDVTSVLMCSACPDAMLEVLTRHGFTPSNP